MKYILIIIQFVKYHIRYHRNVILITESKDWAIKDESNQLLKYLNKKTLTIDQTFIIRFIRCELLVFMSLACFRSDLRKRRIKADRIAVFVWHDNSKNGIISGEINNLLENIDQVDYVFTSCFGMQKTLVDYGVPRSKIRIRSVSIDFADLEKESHISLDHPRQKYKLPQNKFIIGSFQKDGEGWGDGENPKHVKGPDIFIDFVKLVKEKYDVHVLLTGPARGYVKRRLKELDVNFTHIQFKSKSEMVELYRCLNMYVIASRSEGGPKALLEAMALRIPVLSTPVGATDLLPVDVRQDIVCDDISADSLYRKFTENGGFKNVKLQVLEERKETVMNLFDINKVNVQLEKCLEK